MKLSPCVLALSLFAFAACSPAPATDAGTDAGMEAAAADVPPPDPTFANVQMILTRSCAVGSTSCHTPGPFPAGGLDLSAGNAYAQLVGRNSVQVARLKRVEAGSVANSYLINKIEGTMTTITECAADPEACGDRMPMVSGITLSTQEVALIKEWIRLGAMQN